MRETAVAKSAIHVQRMRWRRHLRIRVDEGRGERRCCRRRRSRVVERDAHDEGMRCVVGPSTPARQARSAGGSRRGGSSLPAPSCSCTFLRPHCMRCTPHVESSTISEPAPPWRPAARVCPRRRARHLHCAPSAPDHHAASSPWRNHPGMHASATDPSTRFGAGLIDALPHRDSSDHLSSQVPRSSSSMRSDPDARIAVKSAALPGS